MQNDETPWKLQSSLKKHVSKSYGRLKIPASTFCESISSDTVSPTYSNSVSFYPGPLGNFNSLIFMYIIVEGPSNLKNGKKTSKLYYQNYHNSKIITSETKIKIYASNYARERYFQATKYPINDCSSLLLFANLG